MFLHGIPLLLCSLPLALSGRNPYLNSLKDFLSARAGPNSSPAVWHVRGTFSNPNTGDVFARVEGVEVSRLVNFAKNSQKKLDKSIGDMKLSPLIKEQGKEPWDAAGLVLSHKAYWLLDPVTLDPLTHYRANPRSRRKGDENHWGFSYFGSPTFDVTLSSLVECCLLGKVKTFSKKNVVHLPPLYFF